VVHLWALPDTREWEWKVKKCSSDAQAQAYADRWARRLAKKRRLITQGMQYALGRLGFTVQSNKRPRRITGRIAYYLVVTHLAGYIGSGFTEKLCTTAKGALDALSGAHLPPLRAGLVPNHKLLLLFDEEQE